MLALQRCDIRTESSCVSCHCAGSLNFRRGGTRLYAVDAGRGLSDEFDLRTFTGRYLVGRSLEDGRHDRESNAMPLRLSRFKFRCQTWSNPGFCGANTYNVLPFELINGARDSMRLKIIG